MDQRSSTNFTNIEETRTQELTKAHGELKQAHQRGQELATKDAVTGLPNRLFFQDRLGQAIRYAERYEQLISVLFIDIDDFKTVNDTMGHSAGDELLTIIAERLEKSVRKSDTVARLGGDEFAVILLNVRQAEFTIRIADRILDYLSQPFMISGREFFLSASIGIAVYPDDGNDVELIVRNADTAMYEVKNTGKNGYHFYTEELSTRAIAGMELKNDLRKAIPGKQFELHYQAKVDTYTEQIVSAEALLRWRHPEKGYISPEEFIPLAEETGFIFELDEWVLRGACRQARSWQQLGYSPLPVAVNLSMRHFEYGNVVETIIETLVAANLDTHWLEIELTEGAILRNADHAKSVLERLRELGVRIAIDDFGTGYSSLSQLRWLPIDSLKIDRSFILGTPENHDDAIIVEAIVGLGRKLDLTLVAEGVETIDQLNFLRELGCQQCQGFLFSKPLPADEFEEYLKEHRLRVGGELMWAS